jgi:alpha/beta superfamily hydrolase
MQLPDELQPALWGAVCGAAAVAIVGFSWGGWITSGASDELVKQKVSKAVVAALAPICVDNFNRGKDASAQLTELKKAKAWEQGTFVSKGGWAAMPGTPLVDTAMANSCAEMLVAAKL